jgi:Domain of unknown function (DUF4405)
VNKARANYWVDLATGMALVFSAMSGLVLLLPGDPTTGALGLSFRTWNAVHTWSSLAMVAGVGIHLVLHWKWTVSMTRRMLFPENHRPVAEAAYGEASGTSMSRRAFLAIGGAAAVTTAVIVAGFKAIFDASPVEASQSNSQPAGTVQSGGVACPFGLVDDPYPGRCRRYVDSNGDGICDYSVPGSGSNLSTVQGGDWPGQLRPHRFNWGQQ